MTETVRAKVSKAMLEKIDRYAALRNVSRSEGMRQLIEKGLDDSLEGEDLLKKVGSMLGKMEKRFDELQAMSNKQADRLVKINIDQSKKLFPQYEVQKFVLYNLIQLHGYMVSKTEGVPMMEMEEMKRTVEQIMGKAQTKGLDELFRKGEKKGE